MRREMTNLARAVLEDWVPPVLRDTALFAWLGRLGVGPRFDRMAELRLNAGVWSDEQFRQFYADMKPSQARRGTDNSRATIARIVGDVVGRSVVDVGCGHGVLLGEIQAACPDLTVLAGADFVVPDAVRSIRGIDWIDSPITRLPFDNRAFDTVVCTHTLEHVVDFRAAVAELRRVTAERLILVGAAGTSLPPYVQRPRALFSVQASVHGCRPAARALRLRTDRARHLLPGGRGTRLRGHRSVEHRPLSSVSWIRTGHPDAGAGTGSNGASQSNMTPGSHRASAGIVTSSISAIKSMATNHHMPRNTACRLTRFPSAPLMT